MAMGEVPIQISICQISIQNGNGGIRTVTEFTMGNYLFWLCKFTNDNETFPMPICQWKLEKNPWRQFTRAERSSWSQTPRSNVCTAARWMNLPSSDTSGRRSTTSQSAAKAFLPAPALNRVLARTQLDCFFFQKKITSLKKTKHIQTGGCHFLFWGFLLIVFPIFFRVIELFMRGFFKIIGVSVGDDDENSDIF